MTELPDFEDLVKLVEEITRFALLEAEIEIKIKEQESKIYTTAFTSEKYLQGGKPPSAAFVKSAYEFTGFEGELVPLRKSLAEIGTELNKRKMMLDLLKSKIEVWRSEQANQRTSLLA